MFRLILRIYSYLYHFLLCLILIAVGGIGLLSPNATLNLDMLPWEDPALSRWLFFGGLAGLLSLVLAVAAGRPVGTIARTPPVAASIRATAPAISTIGSVVGPPTQTALPAAATRSA